MRVIGRGRDQGRIMSWSLRFQSIHAQHMTAIKHCHVQAGGRNSMSGCLIKVFQGITPPFHSIYAIRHPIFRVIVVFICSPRHPQLRVNMSKLADASYSQLQQKMNDYI